MLVAPAAPATHTQVTPLAFASPSGSPRFNQMRNPPKAINAHMRPPRHSTATQALPNEGRSVWQWPWVSRSWAPAVSMAAALLFMVLGKRQWDASQQRPAIQQGALLAIPALYGTHDIALAATTGESTAAPSEAEPPTSQSTPATPPPPHVVVVGAGWAGWAAAKALTANDCRVTLLDALPDPTGETPYLTPSGKPFEAGQRGFWKDYPNLEDLLRELGIAEADVWTDFTRSQFWGPEGLEATAPVFGAADLPELPSPFGQVNGILRESVMRLPLQDRVTLAGLLYAYLDVTRDEATFEEYDRMTAHDLFIKMGLSKRLVDDFVRPTLLVGLFKPPEEISAAVALELLYFFCLAHQTSFDVRWMRTGTVAGSLIQPLASRVASGGNLEVQGRCRVQQVLLDDQGERVTGIQYTNADGAMQVLEADACVLALGVRGLQGVVAQSPALAKRCPEVAAASGLGGIDVMAVRLWLDRYVPTGAPSNVFGRLEGLRGAGGTFFMLDQLQPDQAALWGGAEPQGSVLACDFYNASALLGLSDEDVVQLLMRELLPTAIPEFSSANVVDSFVQRYAGTVTWFAPGSYRKRPPLQTSVPNLMCAGDLVRMGDREHGSKGLCQERAYVSGLEAANALARNGSLGACTAQHPVIPVRADEPQVVLARSMNKRVMEALKPLGLASPWAR